MCSHQPDATPGDVLATCHFLLVHGKDALAWQGALLAVRFYFLHRTLLFTVEVWHHCRLKMCTWRTLPFADTTERAPNVLGPEKQKK